MFFGLKNVYRASQSAGWPTIEGRIVSSTVESKRGNKGGTTYHAEVLYEYEINGQTQSCNDVAFGSYGSSNPSHARSIVNRYPTGTNVLVHYSPSDPAQAVLETGISGQTFFLPGFGAVFFLAGLVFFIFSPKAIQRQNLARQQARSVASVG